MCYLLNCCTASPVNPTAPSPGVATSHIATVFAVTSKFTWGAWSTHAYTHGTVLVRIQHRRSRISAGRYTEGVFRQND